jgi:3-methyladenine DNA glycosylase Mpg
VSSKRVGVDYAGEWKDELLRFFDANSKAVSRPRF